VFGRISRQYAYLQRAKRAGRGHETDGLRKTEKGGLAVLCWACPHDGKNLPDGWKDVDPKYRCAWHVTTFELTNGFLVIYICCSSC
jgi:nitrite reductase/ring-hydroxylating ferredoxin subunit